MFSSFSNELPFLLNAFVRAACPVVVPPATDVPPEFVAGPPASLAAVSPATLPVSSAAIEDALRLRSFLTRLTSEFSAESAGGWILRGLPGGLLTSVGSGWPVAGSTGAAEPSTSFCFFFGAESAISFFRGMTRDVARDADGSVLPPVVDARSADRSSSSSSSSLLFVVVLLLLL